MIPQGILRVANDKIVVPMDGRKELKSIAELSNQAAAHEPPSDTTPRTDGETGPGP